MISTLRRVWVCFGVNCAEAGFSTRRIITNYFCKTASTTGPTLGGYRRSHAARNMDRPRAARKAAASPSKPIKSFAAKRSAHDCTSTTNAWLTTSFSRPHHRKRVVLTDCRRTHLGLCINGSGKLPHRIPLLESHTVDDDTI